MSVAHTPGPWTFVRSRSKHDDAFDYTINAPGVPGLAEAFGRDGNDGFPAAEANARLIAAAPDLLAALKLAANGMGANAARDAVDRAIAAAEAPNA